MSKLLAVKALFSESRLVCLNGDLIEISQRYLMPAEMEWVNFL